MAANVIWGVNLVVLIFLALTFPLLAFVALVLLALPTAGIFRLAAIIARDQPASFSDSLAAWRELAVPALAAGLVIGVLTVVLGVNLTVGLLSFDPMGWFFATLAAWGLVATWVVASIFWALLADPARSGARTLDVLRLAVTIALAMPTRIARLALVLALVLIASTIMFAPLLTISVAFMALVVTRFALPLADRIEGRP